MLKDKKAVLFDLDGTLADSMWIWTSIDQEYLERFGKEFTMDLQKVIDGLSFYETAVYFKTHYGIPDSLEKIQQDWKDMAREYYITGQRGERKKITLSEKLIEWK